MFQHCILYQLASGRIVYQAAVPAGGKCSLPQTELKRIIKEEFGEEGAAMCCSTNKCNKGQDQIPLGLQESESLFIEDYVEEAVASGNDVAARSFGLLGVLSYMLLPSLVI